MILRLVWRDRAVRGLLIWVPLAGLIGFLLATSQQDAVRHGLTVGVHGFQGFRYVAFVPWGAVGLYLLFAGIGVRCERLHAALPLSCRTVWLSRVLALVLSAWTLVGTMAITLLIRNFIQGFEVLGRTRVGSLFAQLCAVSALAVVMARLPRSERQSLTHRPSSVLYLALVWCVLWAVVYLLAGSPPGYALLPGFAAAVLGLWVYHSLPAVSTLADGDLREAPATMGTASPPKMGRVVPRALEGLAAKGGGRWLVHMTIWRTCYGNASAMIVFALFLSLLVMVVRSAAGSGLYGLGLFATFWLVLGTCFQSSTSRLHVLDALPISRKWVFACAVLPGLLVLLLGYVGATALRTVWLRQEALVDYGRHPIAGDLDVRVPPAYWEISWRGEPPPVPELYVPPWEEPYFPWSVRLYKGLPVVLYSPYHVPEGSSPGRVVGQLGRAVEDVYGVRIPTDELERRYLQARADGGTALRTGAFSLLDDYSDLRPVRWRQTVPLEVLLSGLPWLLYLALTVRGGHIRAALDRRPWAPLGLAVLWVACLLGRLWSISAGRTAAWKLNALYDIVALRVSSALPGGPWAWWGLVVLLYTSAYLWAQARFERVEVPARPPGSLRFV